MNVIVLGKKINKERDHQELAGRIKKGIEVFNSERYEYLILSGGNTDDEDQITEAEVMKEFAIDQGVNSENILLEKKSKGTIGNAYFTRKLLSQKELDECSSISVVTSCYHSNRVKFVFTQVYGDRFDINVDNCYETESGDHSQEENESMKLAKEFLDPIPRGDYKEVGDQLQKWFDDVEM